jgi:hypothetical protein
MTWHADHTFTVTTAGGSIAGLCNALALRSIGANVHERLPGPMMARGAGIVIQGELVRILRESGAAALPQTSPSPLSGSKYRRRRQEHASEVRARRMLSGRIRGGGSPAGRIQGRRDPARRLHDGGCFPIPMRNTPGTWRDGAQRGEDIARDLVAFFDDTFTFSSLAAGATCSPTSFPEARAKWRPGCGLKLGLGGACRSGRPAGVLTDSSRRRHRTSLPRWRGSRDFVPEMEAGLRARSIQGWPRWSRKRPTLFCKPSST